DHHAVARYSIFLFWKAAVEFLADCSLLQNAWYQRIQRSPVNSHSWNRRHCCSLPDRCVIFSSGWTYCCRGSGLFPRLFSAITERDVGSPSDRLHVPVAPLLSAGLS